MSRSVYFGIIVLLVIIITFIALVLVRNLDEGPAHLFPGPERLDWRTGVEREVWLRGDRSGAELRVPADALGLGDLHTLDGSVAYAETVGRAEGCRTSGVVRLAVTIPAATDPNPTDDIEEYNPVAGTVTVTIVAPDSGHNVWLRYRTPAASRTLVGTIAGQAATNLDTGFTIGNMAVGESYRIEAATGDAGIADARATAFDSGETLVVDVTPLPDAQDVMRRAESSVWLVAGSGVGVVGCAETSGDVAALQLYDGNGDLLRDYRVRVLGPDSPDDNRPPAFHTPSARLRVGYSAREGALVGSPLDAFDPDGDTLAYSLHGTSNAWVFFSVAATVDDPGTPDVDEGGKAQLTLGAAELRPGSEYAMVLTATDPAGAADSVGVIVEAMEPGVSGIRESGGTVTVEVSYRTPAETRVYVRARVADADAVTDGLQPGPWTNPRLDAGTGVCGAGGHDDGTSLDPAEIPDGTPVPPGVSELEYPDGGWQFCLTSGARYDFEASVARTFPPDHRTAMTSFNY